MRNLNLVLIILLFVVTDLFASGDSIFVQANELYQEGDYEMALKLYKEVISEGSESPDLYYNMGNAAFRSNNIGHAILYYEKALKLDPTHEDALHNLEYVSRYRVDTFEQVPELFLRVWIRKLVESLPEQVWSIMALAFFLLVLFSLLFYLFSRRLALKKAGFVIALTGLLFFLISISSAITQHRNIKTPQNGIILSPSVVVRSAPSDSGTELFILHEGTRVKVNEQVSGWQNIKIIDGREGWIPVNDFEYI
jgi:hypothetical protein